MSKPVKKILLYSMLHFALTSVGQIAKEQRVDSILARHFPDGFNGIVLFTSNDSVIFKKAYGYKDLRTKEPLNDSTRFELGSCSKQFTALAILKLQELGKISVFDSLRQFFPELPYYRVTVYQLLTHTSGVPDYMPSPRKSKSTYSSNEEIIQLLSKYKPKAEFKPGDKFQYSNTGYIFLASIIEKASGLSYNEFLQRYFFKPLSMMNTRVYNTRYSRNEVLENQAIGYIKTKRKKEYFKPEESRTLRTWAYKINCLVGQGRINSTAPDLLKWDNGLRQYKVLSKKSLDLAYDSTVLNNGKKIAYGFGYFLFADKETGRKVLHNGGYFGYQTAFHRLIDVNKVLIILSNKVYYRDEIVPVENSLHILLSGAYKHLR